ncbi:hypothetical protein T484DRAFT_1627889, partial [Baffinella frigidus]
VSGMDSDLEAFSHNPTDGSFSALAFQLTENTNYLNQWVLPYMQRFGRVPWGAVLLKETRLEVSNRPESHYRLCLPLRPAAVHLPV